MAKEVPIQKGKMLSNPMTMKQMTYSDNRKQGKEEQRERKSGQTLGFKTPKK